MFSKLELFIALRYLRSKRKEGFISVTAIFSFFGITIGVATLIIVMSVMNGFRYELVNRILGINSHLTIYSRSAKIRGFDEIISKLKNISQIKHINPLVEGQVMITAANRATGGIVKGIKLEDLKYKKLITQNIIRGSLSELQKNNSVIIGSNLANNLGLDVGGKIKLISPETNETIIGSIPRIKTYEIVGIFESGMYEYDSTTIFMPISKAQLHFRFLNSASAIEIFADDPEQMSDLYNEIGKFLTDNYPGLYLVDWMQSNASFIDALKVERNVMFLILTLIILVAAFNIISSLIMMVNDKNKSIALFRTIGIKKESIMRIFIICGSLIGFIGTLFGFLIGVLFSANINTIKSWLESITNTNLFNPTIYFLSNLPSKIFVSDVVIIVSMSLAISLLATIYPALKASKTNPAELLRNE